MTLSWILVAILAIVTVALYVKATKPVPAPVFTFAKAETVYQKVKARFGSVNPQNSYIVSLTAEVLGATNDVKKEAQNIAEQNKQKAAQFLKQASDEDKKGQVAISTYQQQIERAQKAIEKTKVDTADTVKYLSAEANGSKARAAEVLEIASYF